MKMFRTFFVAASFALFASPIATAQDVAAVTEDKSSFVTYVEETISSETMQIRLNGLEGTLSSSVELDSITIADKAGVWLTIREPKLEWSRRALLLGRVEIESLTAASIDLPRLPGADESLPDPEAKPFALPELPVSITIEKLDIAEVSFGEPVFGLAARASVAGNLKLADGSLDADFAIKRLDGPGGKLALKASYANSDQRVNVDLTLSEPADGIVANLANLQGKPPVQLVVRGEGPLSDLDIDLALDVDTRRVLTGKLAVDAADEGRIIRADLDGPIASILPERTRPFFGLETSIDATAVLKSAGGVELRDLSVTGGDLSVEGSARTLADGFIEAVNLKVALAPRGVDRVAIPGAEGVSLGRANLDIDYDAARESGFEAKLTASDVKANEFDIADVNMTVDGTVTDPQDPTARAVDFRIDGRATGLATPDAGLQEALGRAIMISGRGAKRGDTPLRLSNFSVDGETFDVTVDGALDGTTFTGAIDLAATRLAAFAALAGRPLAGRADLSANGTISAGSGGFDLRLDGTTNDLTIGQDAADKLLAGETRFDGRAARTEAGLAFDALTITNTRFETVLDGTYSSTRADLKARALLRDIADISDAGTGGVELTATIDGQAPAEGEPVPLAVDTKLAMADGRLQGRAVRDLALTFVGTTLENRWQGELDATGSLAGQSVQLDGTVDADLNENGTIRLDGLAARVGETNLTGNILRGSNGLIDGELALASTDIGDVAALALTQASGAVNGRVTLSSAAGRQDASADLTARDVVVDTTRVGSADVKARIEDLFAKPKIEANIAARDIRAGGQDITSVDGKVTTEGDRTDFDATARLARNDAVIEAAGYAIRKPASTTVTVETLSVDSNITDLRLAAPTTVTIAGSNVTVDDADMRVGSGSVRLSGSAGERLELDLIIDALPLSIANAIRPQTRAGGTLSGTARIRGTAAEPDVNFDVTGRAITVAELADAGVSPLNLNADGRFSDNVVTLSAARITNGQGIAVAASGTAALPAAGGRLDLDVAVDSLPLSLANAVRPQTRAGGSLTARAQVGGTISNPDVSFDVAGRNVTAGPLADAGISPIAISADGRFANNTVTLNRARATNAQRLDVSASGTVPLQGSGLSLRTSGTAPLSIVQGQLASRGASIDGTVRFDISVTGSLAAPQPSGLVSLQGATLTDPVSNLKLTGINLIAGLDRDRVTIRTGSANLSAGGSVAVSGSVGLSGDLAADLLIVLNDARYTDGETFDARADGRLTVTGPLLVSPLLAGTVNLQKAEITVPESFPAGDKLLDVIHVQPPARVQRTLARIERVTPKRTPSSRPSVLRLDVTVNAPNQIFVRGRGLDAELGGSIRVTGPVTDVSPVGRFELRRGRLSILGQRIDLDEGSITLTGDLDPRLRIVARTDADDVTAFITLEGRVSDLDVTFTSDPELPQDEVLARIVFGRGVADLSPVQVLRLVSIAAELTGGNSPGLVDGIRSGTGLDDLDVVQDSEGNAAVKAGKYVSDNVYLGVEAGANTKATINLDITEDVTARGAVSSDGETSLGIFLERDY